MRTMFARRLVALALGVGMGGLVPGVAAAEVPATPTFSKHIAPIFQEKCEACHRPGSIAPMSLRTFEESRPWARSIKARVETREMPPVAHRQDDRRPGIQERSLAHRRADCHDREMGRGWRPAGRPARHAAGEDLAERPGLELRRALRRASRPRRPLLDLDAEGRRQRHLVEAGRRFGNHRAALGACD